ncbi:hypothetical protein [Clostridium magnum]|uniref:Uncharacterized protein n=1 Tax=Clostridium magnum DSM 2767 TaxID=1121326 RepID=A0A161X451_9CLOT|nr:hypothetical protein [Clostridium magnum]KZL88626.1 hypothetical protein CLMAG_61190 [Clostridium magnum DSM 2767]SHI15218.1 hypothetical protein SAMN02745944_02792 [Clostridium magnum DSM 2767]
MNKSFEKIQPIIDRLTKINKKYQKIEPTIGILIVYMFIGLSMGLVQNSNYQFPKVIIILIYSGGFCTFQMLLSYCRENQLKIFGTISLNILGFAIWMIFYGVPIFLD